MKLSPEMLQQSQLTNLKHKRKIITYKLRQTSAALLSLLLCTSCAVSGISKNYPGPTPRPEYIDKYYDQSGLLISAKEEVLSQDDEITLKRITIETQIGQTVIDFHQRKTPHDELIFVMPILGGANDIADYFAEYFANKGYDTAVVHRDSEFKKPENLPILEDLFRNNVVRDRIAIDYFEQNYSKKRFGTFGISRGAINAATTAGIDPRLEANVLALGATELINVLRKSSDTSIVRFRQRAMESNGFSEAELGAMLTEKLYTSPDAVAHHLDAKKTLLFLALFDKTVPFFYGFMLKEQIGNPETVYLFADHFTALLYTQFIPIILPYRPLAIFPFSYVETKSLMFYNEVFGRDEFLIGSIPLRFFESPFRFIDLIEEMFE